MKKVSRWQWKQKKQSSFYSNPFKQLVKSLGITLVSGFLVAVFSNFLLQLFQNQFDFELAWLFMTEWHIELFLLGTGVLMMLYIWFTSIFGNRYLGAIMMFIISIVLGVSTQQKMILREEPMYPSDFSMITNLPFLVRMMNNKNTLFLLIGIMVILTSIFLILKRTYKSKKNRKSENSKALKGLRIGLFVLSSFSLIYIYTFNTPGNLVKAAYNNHAYWIPYSQEMNYYNNGFVGGFLYNLNVTPMERPENYSKEKMDQLIKKYEKKAKEINEMRTKSLNKINVVYVMSESFSDPTNLAGVEVSTDPMPTLRQRMEKYKSGNSLSEGYGGGTANIEFEALTGLSMEPFASNLSTPYTQIPALMNHFPSAVSYFKDVGHYATAIHPYNTSMYKRKQVYQELGFDTFLDEKTMTYDDTLENSPYISDYSAYQEVLKQLDETKEPDFIHLVTMQNHMPYTDFYPETTFTAGGTADDFEAANYFQGLAYSDAALDQFLDELTTQEEETIVVFWGDHLPGFYGGEVIGNNSELAMHQTPLLIFSSKKEQHEALGTISPIFFMNHVLELANSPVSPYYAFLMSLEANLPAFEKGIYLEAGEKETKLEREELSLETQKLLEEYDLLQYDLTAGNKQTETTSFFSKQ